MFNVFKKKPVGGTPNHRKDVHPVGRFNTITNVLNIAQSPTLMKPIPLVK